MSRSLKSNDSELFLQQFPDLSKKDFEKLEKKLIELYQSSTEEIERIVKTGFTENYENINPIEWIKFLTAMMIKIDSIKGLYGKDKKELLLMLCIFIIIKHLPIDPSLKQLLITIIGEFLPEIIETIINATKIMHTFTSKVFKLLKKLICS